jgi:hypothetical protein
VTTSKFEGSWHGVFALGCGAGTGEIPTAIAIGDDDPDSGSTFDGHHAPGSASGVLLWGCVARATIRRAIFTRSDVGVQIDQRAPPAAFPAGYTTTIEDSRFSELATAGLLLWRAPVVELLARNRFERIAGAAIVLDEHETAGSPRVARARGNTMIGNGVALRIEGEHPLDAVSDFGTPADPGDNVLACNGRGRAVVQSIAGPVTLAGNAWDRAVPRVTLRASEPGEILTTGGAAPDVGASRAAGIACPRR